MYWVKCINVVKMRGSSEVWLGIAQSTFQRLNRFLNNNLFQGEDFRWHSVSVGIILGQGFELVTFSSSVL